MSGGDPLANPVWHALVGPHAALAGARGGAARYPDDVSPFAALADPSDPGCWDDLAGLVEPGTGVVLAVEAGTRLAGGATGPAGWVLNGGIPGGQLVA